MSKIHEWFCGRSNEQRRVEGEQVEDLRRQVGESIARSRKIARSSRRTSIREIRAAERTTRLAEDALEILRRDEERANERAKGH
jgi:predicted RNA-binding Zn ribbon-like protein